jgi:hypothetical protein
LAACSSPYELFFLSAHRFFIVIDSRFRVAADIPWRFRGDDAPLLDDSCAATVAPVLLAPSSAAIALSRRFRSTFNSFTIS